MNISRKWLREFVDITATDKEYDSVMTLAGQKVETTERMDAEIKNVVVGKVLSMKKHENSDHMWVCMVDCGTGEPVQIVTGAQNVHEGDLVPVAQHNSYLPGGIHITKGKLRGVESCGMLCSYKELGLTEHDCPEAYADGIWILNDEGCTVGEDMNIVIGNDDSIVEFEITNNRPDCYSLIGLARETAAAFNVPMKHHEPVVKGAAQRAIWASCWTLYRRTICACATRPGPYGPQRQNRTQPQVDAPAPAFGRYSPDQQHRRYHQLCRHGRVRPADARVRLPLREGRQDRRPPRRRGQDAHHA